MNPENFAEWLRRLGHRVVRTESSYWFDAESHIFQAFPYHWVISPSEKELRDLIKAEGALALRYSTPLDAPQGCASYHIILDDPNYSLGTLDKRSRQNVRIGLKNCVVQPISFAQLAEDGWLLEQDTEDRQKRHSSHTREEWRRRCLAAADIPGFEAWGAIVEGRLVASLMTFQMGDCCEMLSQQSHRTCLKQRVNNALTFTVTREMMQRPGIRSVFYTIQSLDAPPSVDEFKIRMGYRAIPLRQRVVFHPLLEPFANPVSYLVLKHLRRLFPKDYRLAKGSGMLRFNIQGRQLLEKQLRPHMLDEETDSSALID